jgi:mannose-6-phosphate isomerase-like protein (cupin superfamily)
MNHFTGEISRTEDRAMEHKPPIGGRSLNDYDQWVQEQGVPVLQGHYIRDLRTVAVAPWERTGALGAVIQHDGTRYSNDCHLHELPPGRSTRPEHHLFEETVFVLGGEGVTEVWREGDRRHAFEWKAGSLFAVPLNTWHQFHNGGGHASARLISVTSLPAALNLYRSPRFLFDCDYDFRERFGEDDDFTGKGDLDGMVWSTNFVSDVLSFRLLDYGARGAGGKNVKFRLANSVMGNHISEFPVGTYKKAHRHGPGAHVIVLSGQGYSLMWKEGEPIQRYDWEPGTLIIPPNRCFHQHFNTGNTPARYLALRFSTSAPWMKGGEVPLSSISTRLGGDQIEYEDEAPEVRAMFREALAGSGAPFNMEPYYRGQLDGSDRNQQGRSDPC